MNRLSGAASASPVLLENINSIQRFSTTSTVSIRSSVFGSRSPPIPVARSVTVARVASPFSNGRLYQPFFLHALKEYFDGRKRLVKKGDLIAVPLMPEIAQLAKALENEEMQASEKQENDNADNNSDLIASSYVFKCDFRFTTHPNPYVGYLCLRKAMVRLLCSLK